MESDDLNKIKGEISSLKTQIASIHAMMKKESDSTTRHIEYIYKYLSDIHDFLWPVVRKVFPNYAKDRKRIDAITRPVRRS